MRRFFVAMSIAGLAIGGSTACATKKFVRTSVSQVNDKVDTLGKSVEQTQEETRKNGQRINEVEQKAHQEAQAANDAASQANQAAQQANQAASKADEHAASIEKKNARLVYETVLTDNEGDFKFGKTTLPDAAKQKLDDMVAKLKQDPKDVWFEIEGYTDNVGPKAVNQKIGLERAQAVEQYLYDKYQIPLHKMSVISFGEEKPIAPNKTRAGRAQNRRVVVKVLA
jgi:outer membrane protein OmpA-like peptidoglycan-associated protein